MPSSTSLSSIRADAIARRDRGDLNSARALLERALEAATMTSGEDHPEVLITAHLLAKLHRQSGDLSGARRVLENALYAGSLRHGDDHPMLLSISFDLAEIADELGNRHEARKHYTRIARFGPGAPGFDQQQVQASRAWLGPSAPAAAPIQGQPVTLPAPEPIIAPPPFTPAPVIPAPEPVTEPITAIPPVTEWPPIPAPPPAEPIRPLPPVHEQRTEPVVPPPPPLPPPPPPLTEPRRVTPIPPLQPIDQRPVSPPPLQRPVSPPPPVLPPSRHSAAPPDSLQRREPQYPAVAGTDLPGRGVTGYPPQTTVPALASAPPLVISTPPGPAAPPAPQPKRGRGMLIASLAAAAVAVAAAGVTVFLVLGPKGNEPNPTPTGPDGAPTGVALLDRGDRITLTWTDTSNGTAQPIVVGNRQDEALRRLQVPAKGATETTLLSLNKNYEYCFSIVLAYSVDDLRQSEQVCTNRKKASPSPTR